MQSDHASLPVESGCRKVMPAASEADHAFPVTALKRFPTLKQL
jgi:hypothetical protein